MKFIKLEILNLASLDREEGETIHFTSGALGESNIFSIVGPTGSGKSRFSTPSAWRSTTGHLAIRARRATATRTSRSMERRRRGSATDWRLPTRATS